jgi:hypothetical protein
MEADRGICRAAYGPVWTTSPDWTASVTDMARREAEL